MGRIEGAALIMAAATDQGAGPIHLVQSEAMIYPTTVLQTDFVKFTYAIQVNGLSLLYLMQKVLPLLARGSSIVVISTAGAELSASQVKTCNFLKSMSGALRYLPTMRMRTLCCRLRHLKSELAG